MPARRRGETGARAKSMAQQYPFGEARVARFNEAARERCARGVVANILQPPNRQVKSGQIEDLPSGGGKRAGAWNRGIPSRRTS